MQVTADDLYEFLLTGDNKARDSSSIIRYDLHFQIPIYYQVECQVVCKNVPQNGGWIISYFWQD